MRKEKKKKKGNIFFNIIKVSVFLLFLIILFVIAPNYEKNDTYSKDKINLIINNNNITKRLKHDLFINDKNVIYMSKVDVANFFDKYIYLEQTKNQIITTYGAKRRGILFANYSNVKNI